MTDPTIPSHPDSQPDRAEPPWLVRRPSWSTIDYHEQTHEQEDDRFHESDSVVVAAIARDTNLDTRFPAQVTITAIPLELVIVAFQPFAEDDIWIAITSEDRKGITLTLESAWRLSRALDRFLTDHFTHVDLAPR